MRMAEKISLFFLLCFIALSLSVHISEAATVRSADGTGEYGCEVTLTGVIAAGDAEIIRPLLYRQYEISLTDEGRYGDTLCLDSPGGNLNEALQIANYVHDFYVDIVVPPGARCESACAIIFFSSQTFSRVYPTSRIGLHAPELQLPEGEFSREQVLQAYDLSTETIREIINIGPVPQAALRYITSTPHSEMYYPKTFLEYFELGLSNSIQQVGVPNLPIVL